MYIPDGRVQRALLLIMLLVTKWIITIRRLLCRHVWDHNLDEGNKKCTKCDKVEEVYMGWI